jgi:hypothetical protein
VFPGGSTSLPDVLSVPVYATMVGCAVLAVWAGVRALRDQPVILRQLIAGAVVEVLILAQGVVAAVGLARGHELVEPVTFWGYIVVALLLLPGAAVWALAERTRWSSVVLVVAALALAVMSLRVHQLWFAVGAPA